MTNRLDRLVRRFFVPRREYDAVIDALIVAHGLIVNHHECSVVQSPGAFCPVCHKKDGSEPEMDKIHATLFNDRVKHGYEKANSSLEQKEIRK